MEKNKRIQELIKSKKIGLLLLTIFYILFLLLLNIVIDLFIKEMDLKIQIKPIILTIMCIIFIIGIIVYYKYKIKRLKYFINKMPIECVIEDFLLISDGYNNKEVRRKYRVYPIVKVNNELYFTYGDYCISHHKQVLTILNNIISAGIYRKDKSKVEIGDKACLYIKKKIDVNVSLDIENNKFELNSKKESFVNINKNYDINVLRKLNFFEGLIDIEK